MGREPWRYVSSQCQRSDKAFVARSLEALIDLRAAHRALTPSPHSCTLRSVTSLLMLRCSTNSSG
jgi:hypothetical protein